MDEKETTKELEIQLGLLSAGERENEFLAPPITLALYKGQNSH